MRVDANQEDPAGPRAPLAPCRRRAPNRAMSPIRQVSIFDLTPSPENDKLYRPIDPRDPEIVALSESIKKHGLLEPVIATADGYLVSGHRRYAAARRAGLKAILCRRIALRRADDIDAFVRLLREHNRQRDKTRAEKFREELVEVNQTDAHNVLLDFRRTEAEAAIDLKPLKLTGRKRRAAISAAKMPMLKAVETIVNERRSFWPLSAGENSMRFATT